MTHRSLFFTLITTVTLFLFGCVDATGPDDSSGTKDDSGSTTDSSGTKDDNGSTTDTILTYRSTMGEHEYLYTLHSGTKEYRVTRTTLTTAESRSTAVQERATKKRGLGSFRSSHGRSARSSASVEVVESGTYTTISGGYRFTPRVPEGSSPYDALLQNGKLEIASDDFIHEDGDFSGDEDDQIIDTPTSIVGKWVIIEEREEWDGVEWVWSYDPSEDDYYSADLVEFLSDGRGINYWNSSGTDWDSDTIEYTITGSVIRYTESWYDEEQDSTYIDTDEMTFSVSGDSLTFREEEDGEVYVVVMKRYSGAIPPASWTKALEADQYEPNNTVSEATEISVGAAKQNHTITETDEDWFAFTATAGKKYLIAVTGSMDNVLTLFDKDGTTILAEDDDNDSNLPIAVESALVFEPEVSGAYYFRVTGYGWEYGDGETGHYSIQVTEADFDGDDNDDDDRFTIFVESTTGGSVMFSPTQELYQYGDSVTITAVAESGYLFDSMSVSGADGDLVWSMQPSDMPTVTITVTGDVWVSTKFKPVVSSGKSVILDNFQINHVGDIREAEYTAQSTFGFALGQYLDTTGVIDTINTLGGGYWYAYASDNNVKVTTFDEGGDEFEIVTGEGTSSGSNAEVAKMLGSDSLTVNFDAREATTEFYWAAVGISLGGVATRTEKIEGSGGTLTGGAITWDLSNLESITIDGRAFGAVVVSLSGHNGTDFKISQFTIPAEGKIETEGGEDFSIQVPVADFGPAGWEGAAWDDVKAAVSEMWIELNTMETDYAALKINSIVFNFDTAENKDAAFPFLSMQ